MIKEMNRIAAILMPSEIMLAWINEASEDEADTLLLNKDNIDATVLLLPYFEEERLADTYLQQIYSDIFENELASWNEDELSWPKDRTYDLFLKWFDIEYHSIVLDAGKTLLPPVHETLQ